MKEIKFGFTGKSTKIPSVANSLARWWYILFAIIGTVLLSTSCSFIKDYNLNVSFSNASTFYQYLKFILYNPWFYLISGVGSMLYGSHGTYLDLDNLRDENKALKIENDKINYLKKTINNRSEDCELLREKLSESHSKLVVTWLKSSANQLKLNTHDRVTIYYYIDKHFYLLARHSQNPSFNAVHRQKFPTKYGVISQAWKHKVCIDTQNCPEFALDSSGYIKYMDENYGYTENKIIQLHMKSCSFVAISVNDVDSHVGVIVFESEKKDHFQTQKIRDIKKYCLKYQSYMVDFIRDGINLDKSIKTSEIKVFSTEEDFLKNYFEEDN